MEIEHEFAIPPVYFFHINHWTNPFNNLEEEVRNQFKSHNSALVNNRNHFFEQLKEMVSITNKRHKRCKELSIHYRKSSPDNEMVIDVVRHNGTHLINTRLIKIKSDYTHYPPETTKQ